MPNKFDLKFVGRSRELMEQGNDCHLFIERTDRVRNTTNLGKKVNDCQKIFCELSFDQTHILIFLNRKGSR